MKPGRATWTALRFADAGEAGASADPIAARRHARAAPAAAVSRNLIGEGCTSAACGAMDRGARNGPGLPVPAACVMDSRLGGKPCVSPSHFARPCSPLFPPPPGRAIRCTGVGVSVESSPGGIKVQYNNANDARAACIAARGTFSTSAGKLKCANPRTPLPGAVVSSACSNIRRPPGVAVSTSCNDYGTSPTMAAPSTATTSAGVAIYTPASNVKSPPNVAAPGTTTPPPPR